MKWKHEVQPQLGDIRKVKKFAFLPTKCNEYTVWLETYESVEKYCRDFVYFDEGHHAIDRWREVARNELYFYEG